MRILAIRGCNLASLAGEFELDLVRGPLAGAGVFAIVGPTGAGKTTLLDAMCVALFDRTPRLANRSMHVVGRGNDDPTALGAQDVRSLLRRGASAGWAEVDFESGDARRYRARWSVRRARGAVDGRFQDQQVTLTTIDGSEQLGGTKTETLKAIHQRLGLSFDQFRRSALLAQGEFAAFLRADGKDRSELLERMTGTEIYSRLSIAAHAKATLVEQVLRDHRGGAAAIAVLDDDARAAAARGLAAARDGQAAARAQLAEAEAAVRWLAEAAARGRGLAEAEADRAGADAAVAAAEPDRDRLALHRRAEPLRAAWDDAARLDREAAVARGEVAAAGEACIATVAARRRAGAEAAWLAELHEPIAVARIAAGIVERPRAAAEPAAAIAAGEAAAEAAGWLAARRELAPEIAAWRELDARFVQRAAVAAEIAAAERELDDRARKRTSFEHQRARAVAEHQAAAAELAKAQAELARFHQRRGLTLDEAGRHEDEARRGCADIEQLVATAAAARAAAGARGRLDRELAELAVAAAGDLEARRAAEAVRETALRLRDDRARVVADLRRAAGHAHARTELVEGEPCPLCGATEHPWRDRGAFDELIGDGERRLAEIAAELDAAVGQLATLAARNEQRATEHTRLDAARTAAIVAAADAVVRWREQLAALGELILVDDPASEAAAALAGERVQAARGRLEAARTARSQAHAVAKASGEAQARVGARRADVEQAAARPRELDAAIAALDAAAERIRAELAVRQVRHAELGEALAAAIARWAAASPADVAARPAGEVADAELRRRLGELAVAWHERGDRVAAADALLAGARRRADRTALDDERAVAEAQARRSDAERRCAGLAAAHAAAADRLETSREAAGLAADQLRALLATEPARIDELAGRLAALDRAADRARTRAAERRRLVDDHTGLRPALADASPDLAALAAAVGAVDDRAAQLAAALVADGEARARRAAALAELAAAEHAAEIDRVLGEVIGSHDGKLFRSFAQSLTLDALLAVANSHLEELAPRYQLERVPRHDLELQVIDRDLGGEIRSVQSLSGGESFLVSLALALGLSSMSAHDVRVRTLLIDEGFGTLDPATLDSALAVLDALQATGRQVGVISHVPALVERVGAHVSVSPRGGGRSEVIVADA